MGQPLAIRLVVISISALFVLDCLAQGTDRRVPAGGADGKHILRFEVVSIHESAPAVTYSQRLVDDPHSGLLVATNFRLVQLIADAFEVNDKFQVLNISNALQDRRFTITAKCDEAAEHALSVMNDQEAAAEKRQMLLAMLVDRFHLRYHLEDRSLPAYELVAGPSGTKLKALARLQGADVGFRTERTDQGVEIEGVNVGIDGLLNPLSFYLKRTVVNRTALTGIYDLDLKFNKTLASLDIPSGGEWPPLETAVQEQLGLKLVLIKLPTQVVVVEHLEMPTPN